MDLTDEALIARCRRGEAAAWEALVHRYQRLVYAVPRRAGMDDQLAAEVFQSVFARLVEHLDRITRPERIGAWLVTTARRETWRVGRLERAHGIAASGSREAEEQALDAIAGTGPLPDEVAVQLEEQHTVRVGVAALDERCRTLLTLLFYRDDPPSYATIAERLGVPEGSIGPTRARCLKKLRQLLGSSLDG